MNLDKVASVECGRAPLNSDVRVQIMIASPRLQFLMTTLIGAVVYALLLHVSYGFLQESYIPPSWWQDHLRVRPFSSACWFVLINAAGAFSAALPVALCIARFGKRRRLALSLAVGVPVSLYIMGAGLIEYGLPHYTVAWIIDVLQFSSIGLAIALIVALTPGQLRPALL